MTDINFYHLTQSNLETTLPLLLEKSLGAGMRVVVIGDTPDRIESLNNHLWTYDKEKFLPHGTAKDGFAEHQPVWLTTEDENPNQADLLVLTENTTSQNLASYKKCLNVFDGRDENAVQTARARWKEWKEAGHQLSYFQQESGSWKKTA